jgi:hypothetical protein
MPESYDTRLNRRLKVRALFPPALQQVAIRYVDDIAALSQIQQELLCEAVSAGVKSIRLTLKRLKELGPDATVQLLLKDDNPQLRSDSSFVQGALTSQTFDREDVEILANILDECFPGMPATSATALAESPVMIEAVQIVKALRGAMESQNFQSDFVVVTLYAVIKYVKKNIETKIQSNPAFLQTVRTSGLVWEGDRN